MKEKKERQTDKMGSGLDQCGQAVSHLAHPKVMLHVQLAPFPRARTAHRDSSVPLPQGQIHQQLAALTCYPRIGTSQWGGALLFFCHGQIHAL